MAPLVKPKVGLSGVGANAQLGNNASAGVNANPIKGNVGANLNVGTKLGSSGNSVSVGFGAGVGTKGATFGVSPKVQIGDSSEAQLGGSIGQTAGTIAGTAIGGPIGAAAGSAIGSATGSMIGQGVHDDPKAAAVGFVMGGSVGATVAPKVSKVAQSAVSSVTKPFSGSNKGHKNRDKLRSEFQKTGVYGKDGTVPLPDGATANFNLDAHEGLHDFKYGDKRQDKAGDRQLFAYETDYTNDLDYVASMGGISLSRLLAGGKDKATDQHGQLIGNQSLGKAGFGADFSEGNFNTVTGNLKAVYANAGIKTKEEMLGLANKAYADGRINEADLAVQQQTAGIIFDNDYGLASKLMQGRWGGIAAAGQTPAGATQMATGGTRAQNGVYSPGVAGPEAMSSFQHYIEVYNQGVALAKGNQPKKAGLSPMAYLAIAAGLYGVSGSGTKTVKKGDKATTSSQGGAGLAGIIGGAIKSGATGLRSIYDDIFGGPDTSSNNVNLGGNNSTVSTDLFHASDAYADASNSLSGSIGSSSDLTALDLSPDIRFSGLAADDSNGFDFSI